MANKEYESWDKERLIKEVKRLSARKKYGLVWEDKSEDVVERCKTELPVLEEVEERAIESDPSLPTNIIVEGDNYHTLSVLNYTHAGKVDVIYIDPPYNTGAKDWKYNNCYVDENDTYRHSKWLSMMQHRLLLTKHLLKDDGVLIVAIDDNELFHIGVLLEEIFPTYDIFTVTVEHNRRGRRGKNFAKTNEWALFLVPKGKDVILEEATDGIIGGETRNLRRTGSSSKRVERPTKFYPIWVNEKTFKVESAGDPIGVNEGWDTKKRGDLIPIWPIDEKGREKNWHYGVDRTRKCIENNELEVRKRSYGLQVYYTLREKNSKKYKTVWSGSRYDASTHGSVLLETILGRASSFDYPKSLHTLVDCLYATVGSKKSAVVLDFFAGSGTTGHALMQLNETDGGNRRFILATNNENKISEEVTYPRIKGVIDGYADVKGVPANVRYFKTAFVSKSDVSDDTRRSLIDKSTEMLCVKESTFGKVADNKRFKIYRNQEHATGILFDLDAIEEFKEKLDATELAASIYVFSLTSDNFSEDFDDLRIKHRTRPIPEGILEVYRKIFA